MIQNFLLSQKKNSKIFWIFEGKNMREALLKKFKTKIESGRPIIGGGAGTGLSAKCEERGGVDLIVIYNSGKYRMAGRGSLAGLLAYGNANEIVVEMASEVLPVVKSTPVLAGVNGTDPFLLVEPFLTKLKALGFSGIQNFPTVGLIDGSFRKNLEETGMSYSLEVDLIRSARKLNLLTTPYVFSTADTKKMTEAGADIIVPHMGLTTGGSIGAETSINLSECAQIIDKWAEVAKKINPEIIVLCHGGPISSPYDAQYVLKTSKWCNGFYGASSMERMPTEKAIVKQVEEFKSMEMKAT